MVFPLWNWQMMSERQRIEAAPPTPSVDNTPPPPPYEEVNDVFTAMHNGTSDAMDYFLGEVSGLNLCWISL